MSDRYALFRDGRQISKAHSTRLAVLVEAHDMGLVIRYAGDFPGDASGTCFREGVEIREIAGDE